MLKLIEWTLPIRAVSEANSREHWRKKSARHKVQRRWVKSAFQNERPKLELPLRVVITRIAPRRLDEHDNLPMSVKYIIDALAANLTGISTPGLADSVHGLQFEVKQEKGAVREYGVRIEIYKPEKE